MSYEDARVNRNCIYAFVLKERVIYLGRASHFGTRYSHGYGYLVKALIDCGHSLFIACIPKQQIERTSDIEGELITTLDIKYNKRRHKFTPLPLEPHPTWKKRD